MHDTQLLFQFKSNELYSHEEICLHCQSKYQNTIQAVVKGNIQHFVVDRVTVCHIDLMYMLYIILGIK